MIRDFTSVTSIQNLSNTLIADLEKIWKGLSKPKEKEDTSFNDYFDTDFVGLPHKVFAKDQFQQEANQLSKR